MDDGRYINTGADEQIRQYIPKKSTFEDVSHQE